MKIYECPSCCPPMPPVPDDIPISDFMMNEKYGRKSISSSKSPFVCGMTGKGYTFLEIRDRVELLGRSLEKILGLKTNDGAAKDGFREWEKVAGVFSINCIDYATACWAVQRINGIASPANAQYSAEELAHQLRDSKSRILFTTSLLLDIALPACESVGIQKENIFLLPIADVLETKEIKEKAKHFKTLDDLIEDGRKLKEVDALQWQKGYARKKTAFLCYSSGTSGLPKGVLISHHNVITNITQIFTWMKTTRDPVKTVNVLCLLPQSHIYSLVVICHTETYIGNSAVILPKFDLQLLLETIQKYKLVFLVFVPPLVIALVKNYDLVKKYDISSVEWLMTGAAPMTKELAEEVNKLYPNIAVCQGYGMTESCTVVSYTSIVDIWHGSSGCILPGIKCRVVDPEGKDVDEGELGELLIQGDNVVQGYLNNPKANQETFQDGWLRTGDESMIKKSEKGNYHVFVVDRLKDLVKVKGFQVAPAELEGHLLDHPSVTDCAVIPISDERAGELPKAFVVVKPNVPQTQETVETLKKWVADHKAPYKQLAGGVEFIDMIPKSPSGKILRRLLRDRERARIRKEGSRL